MVTFLSLMSLAAANPVDAALDHAAELGAEVQVVGFVETGDSNLVQLQQTVDGVPVRGSSLHVRVNADGTVRRTRGQLKEVTVDTAPTLSPAEAAGVAQGRFGGEVGAAELYIAGDRLVYEARVSNGFAASLVRIDAHTGEVVGARSLTHHAKGKVTRDDGVERVVELPGVTGELLSTSLADVFTASDLEGDPTTWERQASADPTTGNFHYEIGSGSDDPSEEVSIYFHLARTVSWYETVHGHSWGGQFTALANLPEDVLPNAGHMTEDGHHYLAFGVIEGQETGHSSDVILHEVGHGATNEVARFDDALPGYPLPADEHGVSAAHGALMEALPDYFAATQNDDSLITVGTSGRDLVNDARCPDDQFGEVHHDSLVVSGTLWEIRELLGAERADALAYQLAAELPAEPTFRIVARTLRDLVVDASATPSEQAAVEAILQDRGLDQCGRAVPLSAEPVSGVTYAGNFGGACMGTGLGATLPYQLSLREDGPHLVTIEAPEPYEVHVRVGQRVTYQTVGIPVDDVLLTAIYAPREVDQTFSGSPTTVEVDGQGETVFLSVVSTACVGYDVATWSASAVPVTP